MPAPLRGVAHATTAVAFLAVCVYFAYGDGWVGYDSSFALLWGKELANGHPPILESSTLHVPTPHPLANAVAAPLTLLGDRALPAFETLILICYSALGIGVLALGWRLFGWAVGVVSMLLVLTRPFFVDLVLEASIDIPFVALVVWAAVVGTSTAGHPAVVLLLLLLAGLLRPEAWPLAIGYAVYRGRRSSPLQRVSLAALSLGAPIIWLASDLAITGNPLHSLLETRELALRLGRERGGETAVSLIPSYLEGLLETAIVWAAIIGIALAVAFRPQQARLPLLGVVAGLGAFLVLGLGGLSLLPRYLLLPGVCLCLFSGLTLAGWLDHCARPQLRPVWLAGALVLATIIVGETAGQLDHSRAVGRSKDRLQSELHRAMRTTQEASLPTTCRALTVDARRAVPLIAYWLDISIDAIQVRATAGAGTGIHIAPRTARAARRMGGSYQPSRRSNRLPASRTVAITRSWLVSKRC